MFYESGYRHNAVSSAGAQGLGQLMPGTAAWFADEIGMRHYDLLHPVDNLQLTAYGLSRYREHWCTAPLCEHLWVEPVAPDPPTMQRPPIHRE